MAKQVNFTNPQGVTFPISYWRVTKVSIDLENKAIHITVLGHKDNTSRQSDLQPIGRKSFVVTDSNEFASLIGDIVFKVKNPLEIGYQVLNRDAFFNKGDDV